MSYCRRTSVVGALVLLAAAPAFVSAQQAGSPPQRQQAAPGEERAGGGAAETRNRVALERQVRARFQRVLRETMDLTDTQLGRLETTMLNYETRRRELVRAERDLRQSLREAMGGSPRAAVRSNVDEPAIARGLDSLLALQRRRIDLIEAEQRELATFLTPLQRAQYMALQENLRRILQQRGRNGAGQPGRRPNAAPPG